MRHLFRLLLIPVVVVALIYAMITGESPLKLFFDGPPTGPEFVAFDLADLGSPDPRFKAGAEAYNAKRFTEAHDHWLPLAEEGDAEAQAWVGWLYKTGWGVEQDYARAREFYEAAVEQGNALAMARLAILYRKGQGVEVDHKRATELYRQGMERGNQTAKFSYGLALHTGRGILENRKRAYEIFSDLLASNYCRAAYSLGLYHERGYGGATVDLEKAYRFYKIAERGGCDHDLARILLKWSMGIFRAMEIDREFSIVN